MAFNRFNPPPKKYVGITSGIGGLIEAEKLMQVAFAMPACVLVGWGAGWWLSGALHHKWIEIAGVVLGCVSALSYVIRMAIAAEKKTTMGDTTMGDEQSSTGKGTGNSKP
jgi:hypothetical protein